MEIYKKRLPSRILFFAALLALLAYHGVADLQPGVVRPRIGWEIWPEVWEMLFRPRPLSRQGGMVIAAFLSGVLLILAAPFLDRVWVRSKLAWGIGACVSGFVAACFWVYILTSSHFTMSLSICLLVGSLTLNFLGFATARFGAASFLPPRGSA